MKKVATDQGTLGAQNEHMRDEMKAELRAHPEIDALLRECESIAQGLRQMMETQSIHTKILRAILEAATSPTETEGDLQEALLQIVAALRDQNSVLERIEQKLFEPPRDQA